MVTDNRTKESSRKIQYFLLCTILCTLLSLIFTLALIHLTPIIDILASHSKTVLSKDFTELGYYEQLLVERLMRENTLITVDNLWSMQVSFYQTIVSLLIGLNAAILAIAFLIIRSSSRTEAVYEARVQINNYTTSSIFTKLVEKKAKKEIGKINSTYGDMIDMIDLLNSRVEILETNAQTIEEKVSLLDRSEEDVKTEASRLTE